MSSPRHPSPLRSIDGESYELLFNIKSDENISTPIILGSDFIKNVLQKVKKILSLDDESILEVTKYINFRGLK